MALTEEQIKNLKPGDPVIIHGTFWDNSAQGDIIVTCPIMHANEVVLDHKYVHPTCCYLPSENLKHDPCRKFKKGDKVQPRSGKTVLASEYGFVTFHELAGQYEVNEDEAKGTVTLIVNGHACFVSAFALELVTPVEELEPYYIEEKDIEFQIRMRAEGEDCLISTFRFKNIVKGYKRYYDMLPSMKQAREAAEAELNRLNKEYINREK